MDQTKSVNSQSLFSRRNNVNHYRNQNNQYMFQQAGNTNSNVNQQNLNQSNLNQSNITSPQMYQSQEKGLQNQYNQSQPSSYHQVTKPRNQGNITQGSNQTQRSQIQGTSQTQGRQIQGTSQTQGSQIQVTSQIQGSQTQGSQIQGTSQIQGSQTQGSQIQGTIQTQRSQTQGSEIQGTSQTQGNNQTQGSQIQESHQTQGSQNQGSQNQGSQIQGTSQTQGNQIQRNNLTQGNIQTIGNISHENNNNQGDEIHMSAYALGNLDVVEGTPVIKLGGQNMYESDAKMANYYHGYEDDYVHIDSISQYDRRRGYRRKYSSDKAYPSIHIEEENKELGTILLDCFAAELSELSLVTHYTYLNIVLDSEYEEMKEIYRGISIVELHHLNIIGELIKQLGVMPRYYHKNKNNITMWNGNYIPGKFDMESTLVDSIQHEKDMINKYKSLIERADNEVINEVLSRIILDEEIHVTLLEELKNKYIKSKVNA